ncbi:MAG: DUF308 domain-containing protein [Halobacteriales archaeon]
MESVTESFEAEMARWIVAGVLSVLIGLLVLLWPGPVAVTDRLPVALLFLAPGALAVYHAYAESQSPV